MSNTMNAVIYARYSSHAQNERSIEGQLHDCYEYAKRCGYNIVGEYIDRALSGTTDNRESFQRMIADAPKSQFEYIIVYKLDRFARNRYDSAIYKNKLKKYGVRVISAMEHITDSPEGIILESVLEGMAEYYSANLSQNVIRGMKTAIANKSYTGAKPPYGYKTNNKIISIDEDAAPVVKEIFKLYSEGIQKREIVDILNKKGYRKGDGKPFEVNSFSSMLKNKKYIGIHTFDGEEVEGIFPRLIDDETFVKVQEQIARHRRAPAAAKAKVDYLLCGKAFCGYCGSNLVGDSGTSSTKTTYYYYSCSQKKKKRKACEKKREKKDFLEWYVCEQTVNYVLCPERIDFISEKIVEAYEKDFNSKAITDLESRLKKLDKEIDNLFNLALRAQSDAILKRADEQSAALNAQRENLQLELTKLRIAANVKLTKDEVKKWLNKFCNGDLFDNEFRIRIIDTFINSVFLYDDKLVIYYNIKDGKQVSYIEMLEAVENREENKKESSDNSENSSVRISHPLVSHPRFERGTP